MKKNLALFDFDGTISTKDSLSEFLKYIEPNYFKFIFLKYFCSLPQNIAYKIGIISSDDLKKKRIELFFKNKKYSDLVKLGSKFATDVLPTIVKSSAIQAIQNHLLNKDEVYIISASLDIILKNWCNSHKVYLITNTIDPIKKIYNGADCNYNVKVTMLNQHLNIRDYELIFAYGDTEGDIPMLNLAHKKFYKYFN
jgi:phosphatidylglycerophosphatase C